MSHDEPILSAVDAYEILDLFCIELETLFPQDSDEGGKTLLSYVLELVIEKRIKEALRRQLEEERRTVRVGPWTHVGYIVEGDCE